MVAIIGNTIYGQRLVKQLKKNNVDAILITTSFKDIKFREKIHSHQIIHYISSPTVNFVGIFSLIRFKFWHKKIIISWIGTDVLTVNKNPLYRILTKFCQFMVDQNLVVAPHLKRELLEIDIKSQLLSLPIFKLYKLQNSTQKNKILVYLPDNTKSRFEFFQGNIIKKIIRDFPEVKFVILANSGKQFSENNVKCIKWTENMDDLYFETNGVIRLPIHDGLSNTILEALSMGRFVIASNSSIPYCMEANSYSDVKKLLIRGLDLPQNQLEEASNFINKTYDIEKLTKELIDLYDNL